MQKFLFNLFLGIPGTVLHVGGILLYLLLVSGHALELEKSTLHSWLATLATALIFGIGRSMVVGSELLSGTLALPARKDLFAICAALEILAQGLCATAGAFVLAGVARAATKNFSDLGILWGIAALLFAGTWAAHRTFLRCRARAAAAGTGPVAADSQD